MEEANAVSAGPSSGSYPAKTTGFCGPWLRVMCVPAGMQCKALAWCTGAASTLQTMFQMSVGRVRLSQVTTGAGEGEKQWVLGVP